MNCILLHEMEVAYYKLPFSMTQVILHGTLHSDDFTVINTDISQAYRVRMTSTRRKKIFKKKERGSWGEREGLFFFSFSSSLLSLLALWLCNMGVEND